MPEKSYFTLDEKENVLSVYRQLLRNSRPVLRVEDFNRMRRLISEAVETGHYQRNKQGINPVVRNLNTALILCDRVGLERSMLISVLLFNLVVSEFLTIETVKKEFGDDIAQLIRGLIKSNSLYAKQAAVESENFRKLLLSFAEDIRVIIIMIADRLCVMKMINHHPNEKYRYDIACEASYLYAPLAHRLGLYSIKSELEDLSLKYTNREIYDQIAHKLNETKRNRDKYIMEFIQPVKQKLEAEGLHFEIKGRTKSIFSIWNKMKKQKADLEDIYDLFAIRVILETPLEQEKADCWKVYSIVTDMYQPNPKRMKDWLSIPKSNGYESLHITVLGPKQRWVEVQIRTRRMDEIAERGLAAHWKYKEGGGSEDEGELEKWLRTIKEILDDPQPDAIDFLDTIKLNLFASEIFVFTPKGDLKTMPQNSTALDFAFSLHTDIGSHCIGAKVNHKLVPLSHKLQSGDQVEILTSKSQRVQPEWEVYATTARARAKIATILRKEAKAYQKEGETILNEFFKNEDIRMDDATLDKLTRLHGFHTRDELLVAIGNKRVVLGDADKNVFKEKQNSNWKKFLTFSFGNKDNKDAKEQPEEKTPQEKINTKQILKLTEETISKNYIMADCCHPIPGDDVLGYIDEQNRVVIHKRQCPVATRLKSSYGNRIIATEWDTHKDLSFLVTIYIKGIDSMGLLNEVTQVISRQLNVNIRKLTIETNDGIFEGKIQLYVHDVDDVRTICNNLKQIQNIKQVTRVEE